MDALKYFLLFFYHYFRELVLCFVPKTYRLKSIEKDIVLITGAGNGLGRALAIKFAGLVSHLVLWDIDEDSLKQTEKLVKQAGCKTTSYVVDVSNSSTVTEVATRVAAEVGTVTILVNNAAIARGKYFQNLKDEDITKTFEVNTYSSFWTYKAFLPQMMSDNKGHLLTIGDASAFISAGHNSDFMASKAAVAGIFESIFLEVKDANYNGINLTFVCPCFKRTNSDRRNNGNNAKLYSIAEQIIDEMRQNKEIVILPKSLYIYNTLTTLLPTKASYLLYRLFSDHIFVAIEC